jgi:hypothetical protein
MKNPFKGMKRKRLPSMHLITASETGVSLRDALAAYFFVMLKENFE